MEICTERVLLRQWRCGDREPFAALNADPRVMEHFPAVLSRTESDALADRAEVGIAERGWGLWAAEVIAGGEFAGFVGLNPVPSDFPCSPGVEIGWRLACQWWGQGLATEAARAVVAFAFDQLRLDEVVAFTSTTNVRSQRVMERLGMTHDQSEDFDHPRIPHGHRLRRHVLFRLFRPS